MDLIFTDLDGTLLDRDTYSWAAAKPAVDRLEQQNIPWILVSSKTRAEVEFWRQALGNRHPFIVENGGAAFVPTGYFPSLTAGNRRGPYEVMEWGTSYNNLLAGLQAASEASQCPVRGFHQMTPAEIARDCGLPLEQALLAKQREYDEPFLILRPDGSEALAAAILAQGFRYTRGGRFWHITGANDKACAVNALATLFRRCHSALRTIGLGDALNDAPFLSTVSIPVLIRSSQLSELKAHVPVGIVTDQPGPAGWNHAVLELIG